MTVNTELLSGPKLNPSANSCLPSSNFSPRVKYPERGSNTCCQGRIACGLLIIISSFLLMAFIQSGTSLSVDQSPPPITLPARAVARRKPSSFKKEFLYDAERISEQPFDEEYMSYPPILSFSL